MNGYDFTMRFLATEFRFTVEFSTFSMTLLVVEGAHSCSGLSTSPGRVMITDSSIAIHFAVCT